MGRYTRSTGWGVIRLSHARNLENEIDAELTNLFGDTTSVPTSDDPSQPEVSAQSEDHFAYELAQQVYKTVGSRKDDAVGQDFNLSYEGVAAPEPSPQMIDAARLLIRAAKREARRRRLFPDVTDQNDRPASRDLPATDEI
jgi:hypothetical protein